MATKVFPGFEDECGSGCSLIYDVDSRMVRKGCEDRAIEVMERMKAAGVRPNVVIDYLDSILLQG